jgi:hypothetical protein
MKRLGLVCVEIQVRREDVALVRSVVKALTDPVHAAEVRSLLRERLVERPVKGLKALLADAPVEGVDLKRVRDIGRARDSTL